MNLKMYILRENCLGIHMSGGIDLCIEWQVPRLGRYPLGNSDINLVIYRCNKNTDRDDDYRSLTQSQAETRYPKQYELLIKAYNNEIY